MLSLFAAVVMVAAPKWTLLSSSKGDLPSPAASNQQTGAVVGDIDLDGVDDFVLAFRGKPPSLLWYRREVKGWVRYVLEKEDLRLEAGGALFDIDGDADLDVVFGNDGKGNALWWWENPYPTFAPDTPWKRRFIKNSGANQHHDQLFADILGTGRPQLVFWNQKAKTIFLAEIPKNPRGTAPWPLVPIFTGAAGEGVQQAALYAEGLGGADIDGDGKVDLLAGNMWFKHLGAFRFEPTRVGDIGGRIAAGQLKEGGRIEVVLAPGDGSGPLRWYECTGDPRQTRSWVGHDLVDRPLTHGHSLALGDVDGDGHLDVVAAEMAKWSNTAEIADNPKATAWILYGDGRGSFRTTELVVGHGFHELRLGDLDGDGDLDILNKPYTWQAPRVDVWLNNGTGLPLDR